MLQNDSHLNCLCVMARLIEALAQNYRTIIVSIVSVVLSSPYSGISYNF